MKIEIDDKKIFLSDGIGCESCVIMEKPEVDDCSNMTARPLVVNYHLVQETIWERSCRFAQELQSVCGESAYLACYGLLFGQLYPVLLSSSQAKNIICYGMDEEESAAAVFQDFIAFLQKGSSLISLPTKPFVFSALLNKSCHAAIVSLDRCMDLQLLWDAASKIRDGGKVLFYTKEGNVPEELSVLTDRALKKSFGSSAVYFLTVDANIRSFAYEKNTESGMTPSVGILLSKYEEFSVLASKLESNAEHPLEIYPAAMALLSQIENILLDLYDVLENPELPVHANLLKEAFMDCYIGTANRLDVETYFGRLRRETGIFCGKMEEEFG